MVGGLDDVFLVAFSYQARSTKKHSSGWRLRPQVTIWLQVLDDDKRVVRDLNIHTGLGTMIESERWCEHTVSSSYVLSGLSKGVYGLNVYEEMARSMGAREYLNMRLTVKNV